MPDPALPHPRPGTVQPRRLLAAPRLTPRALTPSGPIGFGTQPFATSSFGGARDITVRIGDVRFRTAQVTAVRTRTVTTTARLAA